MKGECPPVCVVSCGMDHALNKGPTPYSTAHPGLLPQGGGSSQASSLGIPPTVGTIDVQS